MNRTNFLPFCAKLTIRPISLISETYFPFDFESVTGVMKCFTKTFGIAFLTYLEQLVTKFRLAFVGGFVDKNKQVEISKKEVWRF